MTFTVKFPIRTKLLLLMGSFVLLSTVTYLALSIQLFKDDKIQLVYELNQNTVKSLAAQTEATLSKIIDKMKLLTQGHRDPSWTRSVFESEPDLVAYTLYHLNSESNLWESIASVKNSDYLKIYGMDPSQLEVIRKKIPIPFEMVAQKKIIVLNSTIHGGAPLLAVAIAIEIENDRGASSQNVAVADIRLDKILKILSNRKIGLAYLVDPDGKIIAHSDVTLMDRRESMNAVPIVQDSISSPVTLQTKRFDWNGTSWLGAFAKVGVAGISVISQVEENQAFKATQQLIQKSVLFAFLIVTLSILFSRQLAKGLTDPIHKLMIATEKLARWDFSELIHVKTQDELANLARAFNTMASDLQNQRRQLSENQADLERKVLERTQSLEQQKKLLFESQDALLRTTKLASLGELAGAAAHEVLNPVNNINIRIQKISQQLEEDQKNDLTLLNEITSSWSLAFSKQGVSGLEEEFKKPSDDPAKSLGQEDLENLTIIAAGLVKREHERAEDMKFLSKEIIRITKIINSMRALSRVGGERRPVDIHIPIEETALTLSDFLQKRNVKMIRDFAEASLGRLAVIGDKDELVQVFSNLTRNAVQAIVSANRRAGIVRFESKVSDSGERVEIRVSDNGTGIADEHRARLFETNFTTKTLEEGTGLGLSISRRLVRAFGGDLELETTERGTGTTFLVWFPVCPPANT